MARFSKRSLEGELLIDHRESPGLTPQQMGGLWLAVPGGAQYESAMYTCAHCRYMVRIHPLRTRERGWCSACDKYLCDTCVAVRHLTLTCDSAEQRRERFLAAAAAERI